MTVDAFLDRGDVTELIAGSVHREAAATAVRSHGWPSRRDEAWHYTDLNGRLKAFDLTLGDETAADAQGFHDIPERSLVFFNGRYVERCSSPLSFARGEAYEATGPDDLSFPMVALNTAVATEGARVEVADGTDGGTIFLVSMIDAEGNAAISPRHRIVLGRHAALTIVETARGRGAYLHNAVIEIALATGATLRHYRLQDESLEAVHVTTVFADLADGARYESFTLNCGARLSRNETHVTLAGAEADVHLNAAQLLAGNQHGDITTVIAHDAPRCGSRQTVKSVLAGAARGVFQGRIEVARVAQKTDGYQMNQALLLSAEAEIDCKPELEIFADDVKCSHGATIGALDPEQLFYLRSRGIPEPEARAMLIRAFLDEALEPVTDPAARDVFETAIAAWWQRNELG